MAEPIRDKGYSWVILAACTFGFVLFGSMVQTMTLLYQALLDKFELSAGDTGNIGGMFGAVTSLIGPFVALLSGRLGYRVSCIIGGLLTCSGLILVAFSSTPITVFIGYGLMAGMGGCHYRFSALVVVTQYFKKYQSFASAVSLTGISIGLLLYAPFFQYLLDTQGFTGALIIHAGLMLNFIVVGALFRPNGRSVPQEDLESQNFEKEDISDVILKSLGFNHLKSPMFIVTLLLASARAVTFFACMIYLSGLAKERCDMSNTDIALVLTIAGGVDAMGKLFIGYILDFESLREKLVLIYPALNVAYGTMVLLMAFCANSFTTITIGYSLYLTLNHVTLSQLPIVLLDIVGTEAMPSCLGLVRFAQGLALVIGMLFTGWLVDASGTCSVVFYSAGALVMLCVLLYLFVYILFEYGQKRQLLEDVKVHTTINIDITITKQSPNKIHEDDLIASTYALNST